MFYESGKSISSVSRSVGVERTSIHKTLSGDRVLPYTAVQALARHFNLTMAERQESLCRIFLDFVRSLPGSQLVYSLGDTLDLLEQQMKESQ